MKKADLVKFVKAESRNIMKMNATKGLRESNQRCFNTITRAYIRLFSEQPSHLNMKWEAYEMIESLVASNVANFFYRKWLEQQRSKKNRKIKPRNNGWFKK